MNYAIISGSHRKEAQSLKVANFIAQTIRKDPASSVEILSLSENPLPLWDDSVWAKDPKWNQYWLPFSEKLKKAEAIVVISPEWAGMVPAGLKNFFLFCDKQELAHKPGLIVTVSAGTGGAYPVSELRSSSYKNSFFCYIPEHVIIRKVESVLNDVQKTQSSDDEYLHKKIQYSLGVLAEYGKALKLVRESGKLNYKDYPFGM